MFACFCEVDHDCAPIEQWCENCKAQLPAVVPCTCRGYDAADPCGHGDTSQGCPAHDRIARHDFYVDALNGSAV